MTFRNSSGENRAAAPLFCSKLTRSSGETKGVGPDGAQRHMARYRAHWFQGAHDAVASYRFRIWKALGSTPSVAICRMSRVFCLARKQTYISWEACNSSRSGKHGHSGGATLIWIHGPAAPAGILATRPPCELASARKQFRRTHSKANIPCGARTHDLWLIGPSL